MSCNNSGVVDASGNEKKIEESVKRVFSLFRAHGRREYLGEQISQVEHMVQCAMLAESDGQPPEIVLAALFHDIGHLLAYEDAKLARMAQVDGNDLSAREQPTKHLGVQRHEQLGADFLEGLGFPKSLCAVVEAHVAAKRYLVYADPLYEKGLSEASRRTLRCQGGPMTPEEACEFESEGHFQAAVKLRYWDDRGKVVGVRCEPLEKYEVMCRNFLLSVVTSA